MQTPELCRPFRTDRPRLDKDSYLCEVGELVLVVPGEFELLNTMLGAPGKFLKAFQLMKSMRNRVCEWRTIAATTKLSKETRN